VFMIGRFRFPTLGLIALVAMGVGSVLPFSPALIAASTPDEEEKNPSEPTVEYKLTNASPRPATGPTLESTDRTTFRPTPTRPLYASSLHFSPAVALNNGLSAYYRC
jgi:hypothetical protein